MDVLKILSMWKDLEGSYASISKKKNLSRSDFFKLLIAYKDDTKTHGISSLIVKLQKGSEDSEDADVQHDCVILMQSLVEIGNYVDRYGVPDKIENLATFLMLVMAGSNKYDRDFLYNMFVLTDKPNVKSIPYSMMISHFNCVESCCVFEGTIKGNKLKEAVTYVGYPLVSDNFIIINLDEFTKLAPKKFEQNSFKNDFEKRCWVMFLILYNKLELQKAYFTHEDNIVDNKLFGQEILSVEQNVYEFNGNKFAIKTCKLENFEVYIPC